MLRQSKAVEKQIRALDYDVYDINKIVSKAIKANKIEPTISASIAEQACQGLRIKDAIVENGDSQRFRIKTIILNIDFFLIKSFFNNNYYVKIYPYMQ